MSSNAESKDLCIARARPWWECLAAIALEGHEGAATDCAAYEGPFDFVAQDDIGNFYLRPPIYYA